MANTFNEALGEFLTGIADSVANQLVDIRTEGLTLEDRVRYLEIQDELRQADIAVIQHILKEIKDDLEAADNADNTVVSVVFALASHVLGHTFSGEEIDEFMTQGLESFLDSIKGEEGSHNHLEAGQFIANAVRDHIVNGS